MVLRKTGSMEVEQAKNRLCHPSLNIKRHILAPVYEKSKEKWFDLRQGCIQVLDLF